MGCRWSEGFPRQGMTFTSSCAWGCMPQYLQESQWSSLQYYEEVKVSGIASGNLLTGQSYYTGEAAARPSHLPLYPLQQVRNDNEHN